MAKKKKRSESSAKQSTIDMDSGDKYKQDMVQFEHNPFKIQRPFKDRNPKTDLIILVAIIAIFAMVIMFLKFPR